MSLTSRARIEVLLVVAAIAAPLGALPVEPVSYAQARGGDQKGKDEETKPQQVSGKVVDRQSNPLTNIEVTIAGPKATSSKKTVSGGAFSFEVPPGDYKITATSGDKKAT